MSVACLVRGHRPLISLALPTAGIQLAQVALTTTDLIITGALGVKAIAAGGLAITLYNQLRTMCVGAVTAVGNLVAGAAGRGEARSGDRQLDERTGNEVRQTVRAVAAALMRALPTTTQVADALGLESSDQVIARSRVAYDAADVPVEYSTNYVRASPPKPASPSSVPLVARCGSGNGRTAIIFRNSRPIAI